MGVATVGKSWPAVPGFCLSRCKGSSHYSSRQKPLEGQSRHKICSRITVLGSVLSLNLKKNVRGNLKKKSTISPKLFL